MHKHMEVQWIMLVVNKPIGHFLGNGGQSLLDVIFYEGDNRAVE